jgi:membrane protein DedA with SNARE-associated domain
VRDVARMSLAVFFLSAVLAMLAWASGITPAGILYAQWLGNDDHPTNWYDSALHPNTR